MTIYVDSLIEWGRPGGYSNSQAERVGARHGHRWCHMVSDQGPDAPELHAMAAKLGLKRAWFQGDHYDLVPTKRAAALSAGALEADRRTIVGIFRANRVRTERKVRCRGCGFVATVKAGEPPPSCPSCSVTEAKPTPPPASNVVLFAADPDSGEDAQGRRLWVSEWTASDGTKRAQLSLVQLASLKAYWARAGHTTCIVTLPRPSGEPRNTIARSGGALG